MALHIQTKKDVKFYEDYFGTLDGATISDVRMVQDEFESYHWWPTFTVTTKDGTKYEDVAVSQDEEGNGPGFLFGLPFPGDPGRRVGDNR